MIGKTTPQWEEVRCQCGCLLAMRIRGSVNIKCRRCKSVLNIPFGNTGLSADQARCGCGNLLAIRHADVLELKCRRCKRCICVCEGVIKRFSTGVAFAVVCDPTFWMLCSV